MSKNALSTFRKGFWQLLKPIVPWYFLAVGYGHLLEYNNYLHSLNDQGVVLWLLLSIPLIKFTVWVYMMAKWHDYFHCGHPEKWFRPFPSKRNWVYLCMSMALTFLVCGAVLLLTGLGLYLGWIALFEAGLVILIGLIPSLWVLARLSPVLCAVVRSEKMSLRKAWQTSKGFGLKLTFAMFLAIIIANLIYIFWTAVLTYWISPALADVKIWLTNVVVRPISGTLGAAITFTEDLWHLSNILANSIVEMLIVHVAIGVIVGFVYCFNSRMETLKDHDTKAL